jgi:hypothetical protein
MTDHAPWAIAEDCPQRASYVPAQSSSDSDMFDALTPDERRYTADFLRSGYNVSRGVSRVLSYVYKDAADPGIRHEANSDLNSQAAMRQENTAIRSLLMRDI